MDGAARTLTHFTEVAPRPTPSLRVIFDDAYYARQGPNVIGIGALAHYLGNGWRHSLDPCALFDSRFYLEQNPDAATSGLAPLLHYVIHGAWRGAAFSPLFDVAWYVRQQPDAAMQNPLTHYLTVGAAAGHSPHPLFDRTWYLERTPDALTQSRCALSHFAEYGASRRLSPHPLFDSAFYLERYPDVAQAGLNPLAHYLTKGWREGRDPSAAFSTHAYLRRYADVANADINPLIHFARYGKAEGREPSEIQEALDWTPGKLAHDPQLETLVLIGHCAPKNGHFFGAERSFIDMAAALSKFRCNLHLVLPNRSASYERELAPFCARIYVTPYKWRRANQPLDLDVCESLRRILRETNARLVYANTIMIKEPLVVARELGIRTAVHCRELIDRDPDLANLIGAPPSEIIADVRKDADHIVANSKATANLFVCGSADLVAPNVVDMTPSARPIAQSAGVIRVSIISSNSPKKGIEDFAHISTLCADLANVEFHIVGPETKFSGLLQQRQIRGEFPPTLKFDGYVPSEAAIDQLDILLSLSTFAESFGRTVAEAMANEKLVIAYDFGAVSELIQDGVTGVLAGHGDRHRVAEQIRKYAAQPDAFNEIRLRAREFVEAWHCPAALENAYEGLFAKVLGEVPQRRNAKLVADTSHEKGRDAKTKLRIAYFCWHFPVPSETFVLNELRALHEKGHKLHVFCRQIPHPDFTPDFPIQFTRVNDVDELADQLRRFKADVVHGHFVYPTITEMVWPAAEKTGTPFTFIAHGQDIFRHDNTAKCRIDEITKSSLCLKVFAPSRFHLDFFVDLGVPPEKITINPNGVDAARYPGITSPITERFERRLCAIHRFVEKKGLEQLILAAGILAADGISVDIYGYGPLKEKYEELIARHDLSNVRVLPALDSFHELITTISQYDALLCPSVRAADGDMDGIPTILMDSMASGTIVIASAISGIPDLIKDEVTGLICEPSPSHIAETVRRLYNLPRGRVERMRQAARAAILDSYDVRRLTENMLRIWRRDTIDIVIVSWNNLPELQEVVRRILKFTTYPYRLIICDNNSQKNVRDFLARLESEVSQVKVIFNPTNSMVGPGTNLAVSHGESDYIVYVCGKEGFALNYNWEIPFIRHMEEHPDDGLAGTLAYSPAYLYGRDFADGNPNFADFRNPQFASSNPDRHFLHVQGGLFAMRRKALDTLGGFSSVVDHNGTDVEFSYFAESNGWGLGRVPNMISLYNKTRPFLEARLDENIRFVHPPRLQDLERLDAIAAGSLHLCPICGWTGGAYVPHGEDYKCPQCGSLGDDRSLWRYLAEGTYTYRRLPGLAIGLGKALDDVWRKQFQGALHSIQSISRLVDAGGCLDHRDGSLKIIYGGSVVSEASSQTLPKIAREFFRLLAPVDGALILQDDFQVLRKHLKGQNEFVVRDGNETVAFQVKEQKSFDSLACRFGWRDLVVLKTSS